MSRFSKKSKSDGGHTSFSGVSESESGVRRHYFIGPQWLVDKMREVYGDAIDYYVQERIPPQPKSR